MAKSTHAYYSAVKNINLTAKMVTHSFFIFLIVYALAVLGLFYLFYPNWANTTKLYFKYALNDFNGRNYGECFDNVQNGLLFFGKYYLKVFIVNLYLWILYPVILFTIKKIKNDSNFIRGVELEDVNTIIKKIGDEPTRLPIGKIKLPIANEVKHFFVGGRPGVGKTNLFNGWISAARKDNLKAIIYDTKMDYIVKFFDENKDLIANPFDIRCIRWTILNDASTVMDLMAIAQSIIPSAPEGTETIWYDAPRDILFGILLYCHTHNRRTNKDIWNVLNFDSKKLINTLKFVKGAESACSALESHKETLASFRNMLMKHAKIFEFLQHIDGVFSIREWVNSEENNFIFVPNYADSKVAMQSFFSLFVETAGRAVLAQPDDINRRIHIYLDEFATIQKMDMIIDILTLARSKGGAVFLGTQEVVRVDSIYGKNLREAILNACGNSVIFAMEDTTDTEIFSKKLGQVEYWEQQESLSKGGAKDHVTMSQQKRREDVVLPSEIQKLKDLTAYVKLANYGLTFVEFKYIPIPDKAQGFIMHEYYSLENRNRLNSNQEKVALRQEKVAYEKTIPNGVEEIDSSVAVPTLFPDESQPLGITNSVIEDEDEGEYEYQEKNTSFTKSKPARFAKF